MTILEDEMAIRSLAAAYSDAANRGDLEGMLQVYAPDGVLVPFGGPERKGHEAIRAVVGQTISAYEWIFQMTHSGLVRVEGDIAHARFWVSEMVHMKDGNATQFYGLYDDELVRTAVGWRFARRVLSATFIGRTRLEGKHYPRPNYQTGLWPLSAS